MSSMRRSQRSRRHSYRYRQPWRGPEEKDMGPREPMYHDPHSKRYYERKMRRGSEVSEDGGRRRSHSTSPLDYIPESSQFLERPSRSPSPRSYVIIIIQITVYTCKLIQFICLGSYQS